MVLSALVIIFFLKSWGQVPILRSIQYVTFKYGDFQKLQEFPFVSSISINSIEGVKIGKFVAGIYRLSKQARR